MAKKVAQSYSIKSRPRPFESQKKYVNLRSELKQHTKTPNIMIKIITASAGSGKTFRLVKEYITTLMSKEKDWFAGKGWRPNVHRLILAVTFTRNSTAEMKERILKGLFEIWHRKSNYTADLIAQFNVSEEKIVEAAERLLREMLYDYGNLRVSTIDSFFQLIVSTFMTELGVDADSAIELNSDDIRIRAVDEMLNSLSDNPKDANYKLTNFIRTLSNEKMEEGGNWNMRNTLIKASDNVLSDEFIHNFDHSIDAGQVNKFMEKTEKERKELWAPVLELLSEMKSAIEDLPTFTVRERGQLIDTNGLNSHKQSAILKSLDSLSDFVDAFYNQQQIRGGINDRNWFTANRINRAEAAGTDVNAINELLTENASKILELCNEKNIANPLKPDGEKLAIIDYLATLDYLNKYLYITGIATHLDQEIKSLCRDNDTLLLNFTGELINKIQKGADASFIYERTGLMTENYMIDEFQDTSLTQWDNLAPLLRESLAQGFNSIVVGDIKQSIYRWRGGSWEILKTKVGADFPGQCAPEELKENYRSKNEIIDFNNLLYNRLSLMTYDHPDPNQKCFTPLLRDIYKSAEQKHANETNTGGRIECAFYKPDPQDKRKATLKVKDFRKAAFLKITKRLAELVQEAREAGRPLSAAVLVRTHAEEALIARALMAADIPFFSSESLQLADDIAVRTVIAIMQFVKTGSDDQTRSPALHTMLNMLYRTTGRMERNLELEQTISQTPLTDMVRVITHSLKLDLIDNQAHRHFLNTLSELIKNFAQSNGANLTQWLNHWTTLKEDLKVPAPEDNCAVRVLTLHSAKGLQFDHVILYMEAESWTIKVKYSGENVVIETGMSDLPKAFIKNGGAGIVNTIYKDHSEKLWNNLNIDFINNLYVATTRAKQEMLILAQLGTDYAFNPDKHANVSLTNLMAKILNENNNLDGLTIGELAADDNQQSDPTAYQQTCDLTTETAAQPRPREMKLRMNNLDTEEQREGKLRHDFMGRIEKPGDEQRAIDEMIGEGKIEESKRDELLAIFNRIKENEWFHPDWEVTNERDLAYRGQVLRPDRVVAKGNDEAIVIDYKFGNRVDRRYETQVRNYCQVMKERGFKRVRGIIYYHQHQDKTVDFVL